LGHKLLLGLSDDPSYGQPNADFVDLANFISTLASDDFNRADGSLGKNWFTFGSSNLAPQILSKVATIPAISSSSPITSGLATMTVDGYSQLVGGYISGTYPNAAKSNNYSAPQLMLRYHDITGDCLFVRQLNDSTTLVQLGKIVSGVETILNTFPMSSTVGFGGGTPVGDANLVATITNSANHVVTVYRFSDDAYHGTGANQFKLFSYTLTPSEKTAFTNSTHNNNVGVQIISRNLNLLKDSQFGKVANFLAEGNNNNGAFAQLFGTANNGGVAFNASGIWKKNTVGGAPVNSDWTEQTNFVTPTFAPYTDAFPDGSLDSIDGSTPTGHGQLIKIYAYLSSGSFTYAGNIGVGFMANGANQRTRHWVRFIHSPDYHGGVYTLAVGKTDSLGVETTYLTQSVSVPAVSTTSLLQDITVHVTVAGRLRVFMGANLLLDFLVPDRY
jgi:hypothetical protein